jgi:deoxyribodipyrimidine photo-lyase
MSVPDIRIQVLNASSVNGAGDFVLYWMIAYRRVRRNFALQRAVKWAHELNKPLVILEALRSGYPWASDRLHRFVLDGMADNARRLESRPVSYYPYVEPALDAGKGLLAALGSHDCRRSGIRCYTN